MSRMLITLMFLAVAKRSRTFFFSFPYSGNKQVCRNWEGAQPGSEPKLAKGNIPYHGCHAQFMNGDWPGGRNLFSGSSTLLFHEFELFHEFGLFSVSLASSAKFTSLAKTVKFTSSRKPAVSVIAA